LCSLNSKNYQCILALVFAIEEINKNSHLLSNVTLGFDLYNILYDQQETLKNSLSWLTGLDKTIPNYTCKRESKSVAVLTGTKWETSAHIGTLLELYRFPQFTFGPFYPTLSNNVQLPSVYQMAPKDTYLAHAMVTLMLHFSWNWVGLIISEDDKGIQFRSDLRGEMERSSICIAFVNMIPVSASKYLMRTSFYYNNIMISTANIIVIWGDTDSVLGMSFKRWEYFTTHKIWVTTSQWDVTTSKRYFVLDSFHGALIFSHHHNEILGFKDFIWRANPSKYPEDFYLARMWWMYFNCSVTNSNCETLKNCSSYGSLEWLTWYQFDMAMSDGSYNIYSVVYAVAHALHEMLLQQVNTEPVRNRKGLIFSPQQLHPFLKNIQFNNPSGKLVNVSQEGKLDAEYDIFNFWNFPEGLGLKVKVGQFSKHFSNHQQLSLSEHMIEWATGIRQTPRSVCSASCGPGFRKALQEGKAACCHNCIPCAENEIANETGGYGVKCPDHQYASNDQTVCLQKAITFLGYEDILGKTLTFTALYFSALTAVVLGIFVKHRVTAVVKANNRALSYTLLISLTCCFLCSLLFIGRPNRATCILQQTTFGVVFTVAVSSVLAKTITMILAFKITAPGRKMRQFLISGVPNFIIPICTLIELTVCIVWLGTSPPFVDTDAHSEHGHIIIVCNKGSLTAFYCVLGYLGSLALLSFTVAFLARNLPDTFNEAKFLTFSMLVFCSVWVTFLPVYHSTKGKVMVAMEVFSILASGAGLLGCIFVPKCYIILIRPEKNCLKAVRDE
uniref:Vomeronasal type-2 receptor 116-like n=1 Tax=Chinchilla lanigera TaxID=34839 RepID=A0A8C2VFW5_CHILA